MDRSLYRLHKSWGSGSLGYAATPAASQANFEFILAATFRRRASNKRSKTSIKRTQPRLARWRQKATPISNRPRVAGSRASHARLRRDQGHRAEARDPRGASFSLIVLLLAVARRNPARRRLSAGRKWLGHCRRAEKPMSASERPFLYGGTDGSNPLPSSSESTSRNSWPSESSTSLTKPSGVGF